MPNPHKLLRLSACLLAALVLGAASVPAASDLFDEIFARARPLQARMKSIRGRFTETTVSSLLAHPTVAKGTFVAATNPPRLVLRYSSPDRKVVAMNGNRLAVIWPDRGESEVLDITQTMKRVDRYFTDADPKQLRRMFDVRAFLDPELAGTYQLDMVPKRKQIRQGLERLQLWIHRDSLTLVQMTMSFPGGDSDTIRLEDQELNAPLAPGTFDVEIPAGTKK
jgi:outer membrane lipoprotein-sorting protein